MEANRRAPAQLLRQAGIEQTMLAGQGQREVPQGGIGLGGVDSSAMGVMQCQQAQQRIRRRGGMAAVTLQQGEGQLQPLLIANPIAEPGRIHQCLQVLGEEVAPGQHPGRPLAGAIARLTRT